MPLNPRPKPDPHHVERQKGAIDFAWRVHAAQEGWTAKVDTKASILLALEGGSLFAVLTANNERGALQGFNGAALLFELAGVSLLFVGVLCAATAVFPLLGRVKNHRRDYLRHFVYFGHVRHWQPETLAEALRHHPHNDDLHMLARQLIAMSKRNWLKHRVVQLSLVAALLGLMLIGVALAMDKLD